MRWQRGRRSDNVEDTRGSSSGSGGGGLRLGGGRLSLGGVAAVVVVSLLMGANPLDILSQLAGYEAPSASQQQQQQQQAGDDPQRDFVRAILGDTEDTWREIFQANGRQYQDPKLILFNGGVSSACGFADSAVGPFYCPGDQRVYLDLQFFDDLAKRYAAAGDFAQAYVIAHEVGHHVQTLLGVSDKVNAARRNGQHLEGANGLLVRQELQADCLAGVWAHHAQRRLDWLETGDLEEALTAANAIGDDRLQRQAQGRVVPDSFTHGTSEQRVRWFKTGFEQGQVGQCDTFSARSL
ncbi:KPN_02809 family neutral zinc metallopeptidase [Pseudomonas sp. LRF_L74]|uniref:KPN_02809 family neutral zinc metallopeptidase n=1 Tax=Pseudomonas sp. LRF_L74 TaxID=3369422 RepID=UPI003F643ACB